ncbi:MAG: UDP-2,3-diacylglucosamine diphosphatase [Chitinophagales bacterium]
MTRRDVEIVVVSDIHLGTYGCHATELIKYLKSIKPKTLILNGDIIDIWQFSKRYFPSEHISVIQQLVKMLAKGTTIHYLTGNHDELLRKFSDFSAGNFHLQDKLLLDIDGKKAWIFHGDVFDASITHARWIAKLGGWGYDLLIRLNRFINHLLKKMGKPKMSLSKKVKDNVKEAVKYVGNFEDTAIDLAMDQSYDYVICGHIHKPEIRKVDNQKGSTTYLNSGDWIENLTALEYNKGKWTVFQYENEEHLPAIVSEKTMEVNVLTAIEG